MVLSQFNQYEKRFFFLYGKTDDEFYSPALGVMRLEEVLHEHLRDIGYQCVIFCNGTQKMYFMDYESKRYATAPASALNAETAKQQSGGGRTGSGPLGSVRILKRPAREESAQKAQQNNNEDLNLKIPDVELPPRLHSCMTQNRVRTAVIFTNVLDFVQHTEHPARRPFSDFMARWLQIESSNRNICIFIWPGGLQNTGKLSETLCQYGMGWLEAQMFVDNKPTDKMIPVGAPHADEIENFIHYKRINSGLHVNFIALDKITQNVSRFLRGKALTMKTMAARANDYIHRFDSDVTEKIITLLKSDANISEKELQTMRISQHDTALEQLKGRHGLEHIYDRICFILSKAAPPESDKKQDPKDNNFTVSRLLPSRHKANTEVWLNLALKGNPGTGKTMIASLIGEIYRDAGILESGHLVKVTRKDLVGGYVGQTALRTAERISDALGGVLFVDEAYQLSEGGDNDFGPEAIDTIMEAMSDDKLQGKFAVVIAGYPEKIDAFIDSNVGLNRRFDDGRNVLTIPDYQPETLQKIFEQKVASTHRRISRELYEVLPYFFTNWFSARDPQKFGNADSVLSLFTEIDENRRQRVLRNALPEQESLQIIQEDFPAELQRHFNKPKAATVEEALVLLDDLIGLNNVKEWLRGKTNVIRHQQESAKRGLSTSKIVPGHYLFIGNQGTGKTAVAERFGEVMHLLGLIGRREIFKVKPVDLYEKYVAGSQEKAISVYKKAINGVLFIDEAHQLADNDNAKEAVRALVPFMTEHAQDTCVIMAGYPDDMEKLFEIDNGLKGRFQEPIIFEDYNASELFQIFSIEASKHGEQLGEGTEDALQLVFYSWEQNKPQYFSNARAVYTLCNQMREQRALRLSMHDYDVLSDVEMVTFMPEDLPGSEGTKLKKDKKTSSLDEIMEEMDGIVGLASVKGMISSMFNRLRLDKMRKPGKKLVPGHYVFSGNPGTGKTTVARLMGKMLHALGLLATDNSIEVGRQDLVGEFSGHTAPKTIKVLESALGGVLFIDEAYQLQHDSHDAFGKEAYEALLAFMDNRRDEFCLIVAGYPAPMEQFLKANPGFKSRFSATINFENYSATEMLEIFKGMVQQSDLILQPGIDASLMAIFNMWERTADPHFGNGREVRKLLDAMCNNQANRLAAMPDDVLDQNRDIVNTLTIEDIPNLGQAMPVRKNAVTPAASATRQPFAQLPMEQLPARYSMNITETGVLKAIEPALLFIEVIINGSSGFGSGFVITPDGHAITCHHVIDGADTIRARVRRDGQESWHACTLLDTDAEKDIALLKLEGSGFAPAVLPEPGREMEKGEQIGLLGYPMGDTLASDSNYFTGAITSIQKLEGESAELIQISASAYPGNSGGPLFSQKDGKVLGILLGVLAHPEAKGINFCRPIRYAVERFFRNCINIE